MKHIKIILVCCSVFSIIKQTNCYELPSVNLGATNILDGGPIRPKPGWYFFQYATFYHVDRWMGPEGQELFCTDTPKFNGIAINSQIAYQGAERSVLNAHLGVSFDLSLLLYSQVEKNRIGIKNGNTGFGDSGLGVYLQWDTIMRGDRPIFAHRILFGLGLPTGEFDPTPGKITPGDNIFFLNPYWAATLYFTPKFTASWRIYYLWCAKNHATEVKPGQAIHLNYSLAYEMLRGFNIGINGYFLRQITNNEHCGIEIPHTKEQTFGVGPGAVYFFSKDLIIISHLYYENAVKNRTQGMNFNFSLVKHF